MRIRGALLLMVVVAGRAAAQAPALPVVNAGNPRGFTIGAMVASANEAAGNGTGFQVGATAGFRRFSVGAFASTVDGSSIADANYRTGGATLGLKLLGGPLVPLAVNLQVGAAYSAFNQSGEDDSHKLWHVPAGLGISWTIPQPVVALKPWIAPRLDYTRLTTPDPLADPLPGGSVPTVTESDSNFGLSAGISFGFLNGLAIDVAVDRVFGPLKQKPTTFGVGLSYTIK